MTIDTEVIRRELLDASEHLFRPNFVCCEGCRIAGTRVIELVEALEEARAEVGRLAPAVVALAAFVIGEHELNSACGCHGTPGVDCEPWCAACRVLAGLPAELIDAANAKRAEAQR